MGTHLLGLVLVTLGAINKWVSKDANIDSFIKFLTHFRGVNIR